MGGISHFVASARQSHMQTLNPKPLCCREGSEDKVILHADPIRLDNSVQIDGYLRLCFFLFKYLCGEVYVLAYIFVHSLHPSTYILRV